MKLQIFVDMDGVLADFDTGYKEIFKEKVSTKLDNVDWKKIRNTLNFYASLPPMPDFDELWSNLEKHNPIILTGVPSDVPEAIHNKRAWVDKNIGKHAKMIACKSKDKCLHGKPGDILIDDWIKYKELWINMGGHWITHKNAENSLELLDEYLFRINDEN